MNITHEIIKELYELASWEGCETGDLCYTLIDIYEGCGSYASDEFQKILEKEIIDQYNYLKERKMEEDIETIERVNNMSIDDKRKLVLDKLTQEDKEILGLC